MEFKCELTGVFVSDAKGSIVLRFMRTSLWMGYDAVIPSVAYWEHEDMIRLDEGAMKALKILRDHRSFQEYLNSKAKIEKTCEILIQDREYRNLCKIAGGTYFTVDEFHEKFLAPIATETDKIIRDADRRLSEPDYEHKVYQATFDSIRLREDFFGLGRGPLDPGCLKAHETRVSHPDELVDESGVAVKDRITK